MKGGERAQVEEAEAKRLLFQVNIWLFFQFGSGAAPGGCIPWVSKLTLLSYPQLIQSASFTEREGNNQKGESLCQLQNNLQG